MGDVHPSGNPHYWLGPDNGRRIALAIQKKLAEISPADAAYFAQRYADFDRRLADAEKRWQAAMAPYKGTKVVTYHRSWPNFTEAFGLNVIGYVEPKPGIPPSPSHTLELIQEMKRQQVKVIMIEPYFDRKTPDSIARETGAQVIVLSPSVGGEKEVTDYFKLFDYNVNLVVNAIKQTGTK
jgi:zinc/manganese transport system substrate-binding protein